MENCQSDSSHAKIPLMSLPKQANQLYLTVAANLEAEDSNMKHLMSFYSFFTQIFGCLVCARNCFRCLFYSLIYIKDPTTSHLPIYGTYFGVEGVVRREEEDGNKHLFRSNFPHINQNIKIIVQSCCHKFRRH